MKSGLKAKPRVFSVGGVDIKDHGKVVLESGEMISLTTSSGKECDITAMDWGFYLGPSLNGRLKKQGFRSALVKNSDGKLFVNAIEEDQLKTFERYLEQQGSKVVRWFDEID